MAARPRWLGVLLILGMVLGSGAWVFNPSGEPGKGIVWTRYQTKKTEEREAAVARQNYCPTGDCVIRLESVEVVPPQPTFINTPVTVVPPTEPPTEPTTYQ